MRSASRQTSPFPAAARRRLRWLSVLAAPALAALAVVTVSHGPDSSPARPGAGARLDAAAAPADSSGLPAHVLMGYWQDFTNGATPRFTPPTSYPSIRGAMTWSINWDASNGYNFANTVAPHLASLP